MRNWPTALISLVNTEPTEIAWAELYTITLATPTYSKVFDQFQAGAISGFWTANGGTFGVAQGTDNAVATALVGSRANMHWNRNSFLANQFSQAMVTVLPISSGQVGVAVRVQPSVESMYAWVAGVSSASILKIIFTGSSVTVSTLATFNHTLKLFDILRLAAKGTLLLASINGNVVAWANDSTLTSGSPGLSCQATVVADAGGVTNWVGGSIGQQYLWTNWEEPITLNGQTWQATGTNPDGVPLITRSKLSFTKGTEVGQMDISWADNGSVEINGLTLLQALVQKQFDGATIDLSLAAMVPGGSFIGPGSYFFGRVSDVTPSRTICKITVKDKREEMNQNLPRAVIQQGCRWTLFDSGCTLNAQTHSTVGTVQPGSNASVLQTNLTQGGPIAGPATGCSLSSTGGHAIPAQTYYVRATYITAQGETIGGPETNITLSKNQLLVVGSPPSATGAITWNCYVSTVSGDEELQNIVPLTIGSSFTMPDYQQSPSTGLPVPTTNQTGFYDLGFLIWLTGANTGTVSAVRTYTNPTMVGAGVITFYVPLRNQPATGDTFRVYAGCDKQLQTCISKFNNVINYGGTPFIPPPETTV